MIEKHKPIRGKVNKFYDYLELKLFLIGFEEQIQLSFCIFINDKNH